MGNGMTATANQTNLLGGLSRAQLLRIAGGLAAGAAVPGLLSGCGDDSDDGTTTLTLVGVADEKDPLDVLTAAYTDSGAGVSFRTSYAPTDQVQTSVRAQLGGGNAPDLHVLYPGSGSAMSTTQVAKAGLVADLSDQVWTSAIPENLAGSFQYEGRIYLFSSGVTVIGTVYNRSVFDTVGVEIPTTWPELLSVCETIKSQGVIPLALGAQTQWVTQLITYALVASLVYAEHPDFDDQMLAGQATFAGSGWHEAMERYLELRDLGYFNDNPNGTTLEQQTAMVATGEAAMAVQVAPLLPAFRDAASDPEVIDMFPFPGADTADQLMMWSGPNVGLGVNARGDHVDTALAFVEWLGRPENMNRWCEVVSAIPLVRDENTTVDPALESFVPLLEAGKVAAIGHRWPNPEVQPAHFAAIQQLLADEITVDGALASMDEAYARGA
jgi:raffinose/stachyose/melibiose transport system substrate-binding protein